MSTPVFPSKTTSEPSIARWKTPGVLDALQTRRVVLLAGARQCGKTTLARALHQPQAVIYRTLDDVALLAAARADPHGFVAHGNGLMVIDEIQRAPSLLLAIKKEVDENPTPGRFLLTGSANIQSSPGVTESLAGRVAHQRLRPFSAGEIARVCGFQKGNSEYKKRLLAMGLTPNTEFKLVRRAPLGDPVQLEVRNFQLSLRKKEAELLLIERVLCFKAEPPSF